MDKQGNINNPANAANASQFAQPFMQALIQKNAQNAFLNPANANSLQNQMPQQGPAATAANALKPILTRK
jgi:hypothetical protein